MWILDEHSLVVICMSEAAAARVCTTADEWIIVRGIKVVRGKWGPCECNCKSNHNCTGNYTKKVEYNYELEETLTGRTRVRSDGVEFSVGVEGSRQGGHWAAVCWCNLCI
jgi:hypothetical protein